MQIKRFHSVHEFWPQAETFLCRHEAEHNLLLGVGRAVYRGMYANTMPYLALIKDGGAVVAAALRTPPHPLLISSDVPSEALDLLVEDVHAVDRVLTRVTAASATARGFAERWQARTGEAFSRVVAMRIYRLERVVPPALPASGHLWQAQPEDRDLLIDWTVAFSSEAVESLTRAEAADVIDSLLDGDPSQRGLRVWMDDGQVVSMAAYTGPTPHGIRVNYVYTPPEQRGNGYASTCVAALSQELLDHGRQFCFLFTDLANPTSNHIYQEIGYQPVSDVDMLRFGEDG